MKINKPSRLTLFIFLFITFLIYVPRENQKEFPFIPSVNPLQNPKNIPSSNITTSILPNEKSQKLFIASKGQIFRFQLFNDSFFGPDLIFGGTNPISGVIDMVFDYERNILFLLNSNPSSLVAYRFNRDNAFHYISTICEFPDKTINISQIKYNHHNNRIYLLDSKSNRLLIYNGDIKHQTTPMAIQENIIGKMTFDEEKNFLYLANSKGLEIYSLGTAENNYQIFYRYKILLLLNSPEFIINEGKNDRLWIMDRTESGEVIQSLQLKDGKMESMIFSKDFDFAGVTNIFMTQDDKLAIYYSIPSPNLLILNISNPQTPMLEKRVPVSGSWDGQMFYFMNQSVRHEFYVISGFSKTALYFFNQTDFSNPVYSIRKETGVLEDITDISVDEQKSQMYLLSSKAKIEVLDFNAVPIRTITGNDMAQPYRLCLDTKNQLIFVMNKPFSRSAYVTGYSSLANGQAYELYHWEGALTGFLHNLLRDMEIDINNKELFVCINDNTIAIFSYDFNIYNCQGGRPIRIIKGKDTLLKHPIAISIDYKKNHIWILNHPPGQYYVTIYDRSSIGDVKPIRKINCSFRLNGTHQMVLNERKNQVIFSNHLEQSLLIYRADDNLFDNPMNVFKGNQNNLDGYFTIYSGDFSDFD